MERVFDIDGETGEIVLAKPLDYEAKSSHRCVRPDGASKCPYV